MEKDRPLADNVAKLTGLLPIVSDASKFEIFIQDSTDTPVRGFIHRPSLKSNDGLVITHGAGSNSESLLLIAVAEVFASAGFTVLRCDLPFRQVRPHGPPRSGDAIKDRDGIKNAVSALRRVTAGRMFLGGHSYGGRQATMLAADEPELVDGLLLLSYPLHPPLKPLQLRTQHLPNLKTPCLFMHGTRDPFGSIEEMETSLCLIPARYLLRPVQGAGHDLGFKKKSGSNNLAPEILKSFQNFF